MIKGSARRFRFSSLEKKDQILKVFANKTTVYLLIKPAKRKPVSYFLASSDDGLDFILGKKPYQLKKEALAKFKKPSLAGYEKWVQRYSPFGKLAKLTIETAIKNFPCKEKTLIIYHFRDQMGNYLISSLILVGQETLTCLWANPETIGKTEEFWPEKKVSYLGFARKEGRWLSYWQVDEAIWILAYPESKLTKYLKLRSRKITLHKPGVNPVIKPRPDHAWEAFNTFNPAALYEAGKVHLLYRAQGFDYLSVVGYASSQDGLSFDQRLDEPVYDPRLLGHQPVKKGLPNFQYVSGGGYGGSEDPRLTRIDERIYMTYVDFDGDSPPRIALTSIAVEDFLNHRWLWERPIIISPPGVVDKSACLLPKKINGQYVIFHRIFPNILIDFVKDLKFGKDKYLKGQYKITPRRGMWDSRKIGAGAPPLETEDGWLLIYQAVDDRDDSHYQVGAMILDLNNPTKVLYRSQQPILTPDQTYENEGFKAGVVYPCGAVIIEGTLFVYYGGADSYVCVATANLKNFLYQLKSSSTTTLEPTKIELKL